MNNAHQQPAVASTSTPSDDLRAYVEEQIGEAVRVEDRGNHVLVTAAPGAPADQPLHA